MAGPVIGGKLNELQTSVYTPDYAYTEGLPDMVSLFRAASGGVMSRQQYAFGRTYNLAWGDRQQSEADYLRQWEAQYRQGRFIFYDHERTRNFPGRFAGPLEFSPLNNNRWSIKGQFIEIAGVNLASYPDNWNRDAIFIEERDIDGNDRVKKTGTWTIDASANHHSSAGTAALAYKSNTPGDYCEFIYYGYGFRVWSMKDSNLGKVKISLDGSLIDTVDLYSAAPVASAAIGPNGGVGGTAVQTNHDLGLHRVKLEVDATKNAASSDFRIYADAIEVMQ